MPAILTAASGKAALKSYEALKDEFFVDADDVIDELNHLLEEGKAGKCPLAKVVAQAKQAAQVLKLGADSYDLSLLGITTRRFSDYLDSATDEPTCLQDIKVYAEELQDLISSKGDSTESGATLLRRLPTKQSVEVDNLEIRNVELMLVMESGVATRMIERELQECGYRVMKVDNSFKALEMIIWTMPDFVIISAMMPDLSGIELALALKAMPSTRNIASAILTSLPEGDERLSFLPETIPVIRKGDGFADDLLDALQNQFLV